MNVESDFVTEDDEQFRDGAHPPFRTPRRFFPKSRDRAPPRGPPPARRPHIDRRRAMFCAVSPPRPSRASPAAPRGARLRDGARRPLPPSPRPPPRRRFDVEGGGTTTRQGGALLSAVDPSAAGRACTAAAACKTVLARATHALLPDHDVVPGSANADPDAGPREWERALERLADEAKRLPQRLRRAARTPDRAASASNVEPSSQNLRLARRLIPRALALPRPARLRS